MKETRNSFISVRLTRKQHEQLKKMASDNSTNPSTIIYELIIQKLSEEFYLDDKKENITND